VIGRNRPVLPENATSTIDKRKYRSGKNRQIGPNMNGISFRDSVFNSTDACLFRFRGLSERNQRSPRSSGSCKLLFHLQIGTSFFLFDKMCFLSSAFLNAVNCEEYHRHGVCWLRAVLF
jgi:hypothetical protein